MRATVLCRCPGRALQHPRRGSLGFSSPSQHTRDFEGPAAQPTYFRYWSPARCTQCRAARLGTAQPGFRRLVEAPPEAFALICGELSSTLSDTRLSDLVHSSWGLWADEGSSWCPCHSFHLRGKYSRRLALTVSRDWTQGCLPPADLPPWVKCS